jgi:CheY-like chemotaxis protein
VIRGLGDDVTVVGVGTEREARRGAEARPDYDLVLLDLHLGDGDGFALLAELRGLYPALPIVVVSASDTRRRRDPRDRRRRDGLRAQARASNETLFDALRLVMSAASTSRR